MKVFDKEKLRLYFLFGLGYIVSGLSWKLKFIVNLIDEIKIYSKIGMKLLVKFDCFNWICSWI